MIELPQANTILVVDDEASLRYFLTEELEGAGYQVYPAADGQEALAVLEQKAIDLAIIDLQMPRLNGLELMAAVEKLDDPPELIMLTAHASLETSIEAMRRGSSDFLLKPYQIEELLESVKRALARRRRMLQQKLAVRLLAESLGLSKTAKQDSDETLQRGPDNSLPSAAASRLTVHGLTLDLETLTVTKAGQPLALTPTELRLLVTLMKRPNYPYTFQELAELTHSQQGDLFQSRDLLKSHMGRLRQKLGQSPNGKPYIVNVYGVGVSLHNIVDNNVKKMPFFSLEANPFGLLRIPRCCEGRHVGYKFMGE